MRRANLFLAFALPLLAACQLSLPGRDRPAAEANPITGGAITTTTLDAAPVPDAQPPEAPRPPQADQAKAKPADATPPSGTIKAEAASSPTPPVPLKSASQIACEKEGGTWARAGAGGGQACVRRTRDGGRQCDSKTDCQGECLARSRTCAPIQPLFGCNAVLMDNGAEVSLCID